MYHNEFVFIVRKFIFDKILNKYLSVSKIKLQKILNKIKQEKGNRLNHQKKYKTKSCGHPTFKKEKKYLNKKYF